MKQKLFRKGSGSTAFVKLDTKKCTACWKCINVCAKNVIDRINLPWHKHARFVNSAECSGCLRCVKICSANAIVGNIN